MISIKKLGKLTAAFLFIFSISKAQSLKPQKEKLLCGTQDELTPEENAFLQQVLTDKRLRKTSDGVEYICRLAIDIDSDTYEWFHGDTTRIKYEVLTMIDRLSKLYEKEVGTRLVVTNLHIWKDPSKDPYRGEENIFNLLHTARDIAFMKSLWPNDFHKLMYLPTKDFVGAGGVASGDVNVSPFGHIRTMAHELGHNFDAPHTQNCNWPGGPLDFCYVSEGECGSNAENQIIGTIMSYCDAERATFHPRVQEVLRGHSILNLLANNDVPQKPVLPESYPIKNGHNFLIFNPSERALSYTFEIAGNETFENILFSGSTTKNLIEIDISALPASSFVRVKASNQFGDSEWSSFSHIDLSQQTSLKAPILISPVNHEVTSRGTDVTFTLKGDPNAQQYEFEVYTNNEFRKKNAYISNSEIPEILVSGATEITQSLSKLGINGDFKWRARAIRGGEKSPWSPLAYARQGLVKSDIQSVFYDFDNLPTSFPVDLFFSFNPNMEVIYQVLDLSNSEIVFEDSVSPEAYQFSSYSSLIEGLEPGKEYELIVKPTRSNDFYAIELYKGSSYEIRRPFKTTSDPSDSKLLLDKTFYGKDSPHDIFFIRSVKNYLLIGNEEGISRYNIYTKEVKKLNSESSKGLTGNMLDLSATDKQGHLWVVSSLTEKGGEDEYGFSISKKALIEIDVETMEVIGKTTFTVEDDASTGSIYDTQSGFFFGSDNISQIQDGKLKKIRDLDPSKDVIAYMTSSPGYHWFLAFNYSDPKDKIIRVDRKTLQMMTMDNNTNFQIPSYISSIVADEKDHLWVKASPYSPGLKHFDGSVWTDMVGQLGSPYVVHIQKDQLGNIYALVFNFDGPSELYRFEGNTAVFASSIDSGSELNTLNSMVIDKSGKPWFFDATHIYAYDYCPALNRPVLSGPESVRYGEDIQLQNTACQNTLWLFSDQYSLGNSELTVSNAESSTNFEVSCYENGCTSEPENKLVAVVPNLLIGGNGSTEFCQKDEIVLTGNIQGDVLPDNQFDLIFIGGGEEKAVPVDFNTGQISGALEGMVNAGQYQVYLRSSNPASISEKGIMLEIFSAPNLTINGNFNICDDVRPELQAVADGNGPFSFEWFNSNQNLINTSNAYQVSIPGQYSISVTDSKGCSNSQTFTSEKIRLKNISISTEGNEEFVFGNGPTLSVPDQNGRKFTWLVDGVEAAGENSNTFNQSISGNISVKIEEGGCEYETSPVSLKLILSNRTNEAFSVFPNPAVEYLKITGLDAPNADIRIFNSAGKEVSFRQNGDKIHLSHLQPGVYNIRISEKNSVKNARFVKN